MKEGFRGGGGGLRGGGGTGGVGGSTNDRLRLREFYQYNQPCVGSSAAGVVAWRASRGSVSRGIVTASLRHREPRNREVAEKLAHAWP